jgi:hypothetical protein
MVLVPVSAGAASGGASSLLQILAIIPTEDRPTAVMLVPPRANLSACLSVPLSRFHDLWSAAGNFYVVAAYGWEFLPRTGNAFFGGMRDAEGSYHWVVAECDTDAVGNILRY